MVRASIALAVSILVTCADVHAQNVDVASGQPDPAAVRRAVDAFGIGKKVEIRTLSNARIRGWIRSIDADSFRLQVTGNLPAAEVIPYATVTAIRGTGMDAGTAIWIGVGVGLTILVLLAQPWRPS